MADIFGGDRKLSTSERFFKASKIIDKFNNSFQTNNANSSKQTVEVEFADDSASNERKSAPIKKLYETTFANNTESPEYNAQLAQPSGDAYKSYEYDFEDAAGIMLNCRIEDWNKGLSLFGDFLRDAKKYYKKTCLSAKFIYFFSYRPMYRELNYEQLCWYLFWRSRIRDGEFVKTGLSYIFLYIYEQINLSDIIGQQKVYENIIAIWKNYRAEFPRMDKYVAEWLIDFAFINKMKIDLNDIEDILPGIINLVTIPEVYMKDDFFRNKNNADMIIKNMSVYDYSKSKFYSEKNKELFDYHINQIFHSVLSSESFDGIIKKEIADGVKVKATRESFMGAVCVYDYKKKITVEYKNLYKNFYIRECITDIIRYAENILRDYLGIKSKLTVTALPETLKTVIEEYKVKYLTVVKAPKISIKTTQTGKSKKNTDIEPESEPVEFNPNISAAAEIEKSSWDTTMTLVELQNRDSATSFAEELSDAQYDDGEFIAIDTGDPEDYAELEEIAPVGAGIARPLPGTESDEDIFDVLENLENPDNVDDTTDIGRFIASLNDDELSAVEMLINNIPAERSFDEMCGEFLKQQGAILESVIDTVNEKALDFTGDIVFDTASQDIIDDYREEIVECLKK
ncbi:MAG: TerB N-terminal domain-containing protein [Oscillospiraceae bacterium]|nr:TerB N-terminal domain-containing protein [Oscillospiraceae bacterium]